MSLEGSRAMLVGESNPYGSDSTYALWPQPPNSAGARLSDILGLGMTNYLRYFDRVNLLRGDRWSTAQARIEADRIRESRLGDLVLLGRKVAAAFGLDFTSPAPGESGRLFFRAFPRGDGGRVLVLPHPSGRNLLWNLPENRALGRRMLRDLIGVPEIGRAHV